MLDAKHRRLGVDYSLEDRLLRALSDRTARIQEESDTEARRAIAGISGPDLWPEKKRLIDECDQILDRLEALYAQQP
jgi:hypothetical protein